MLYLNAFTPLLPTVFNDSLTYLEQVIVLKNKLNEVIKNLNEANFYSRGLKPGANITLADSISGSALFTGESETIIKTVINNTVFTSNKPGWHKIFTTKEIDDTVKSGLTFLFQEQPLNDNCPADALSWGLLKLNFVYQNTDADIDLNSFNIKIVDFGFEEERNIDPERLKDFKLVRRVNPCTGKNIMELYYNVRERVAETECEPAKGPAALFTLVNIDNSEVGFDTFITLENNGVNDTTYDGITGIETLPIIYYDFDTIGITGDVEGNSPVNSRDLLIENATVDLLIDSIEMNGDVKVNKFDIPENHKPYEEDPTKNDILLTAEVPKLIDKIKVENTGDITGSGEVVVPEVLGAENNIEITIENTFDEEAFKESVSEAIKDPTIKEEIGDIVNEYSSAGGGIPADGSMVVYLAPVSGDDSKDGLTEDNAMKTMNALLNKGYAKELEVHLVGESPSAEGEGIIVVNGANYTLIKIIDDVAILAGYSLEVNNSNVIISTDLPSTMPYDEILIEENTIIDYDSTTERVHYNCYTISNDFAVYTLNETEPEGEPETETYYNIMPLQLTMGNMYSLEATNSVIDIQGTFTDILNCKLENTTLNNSIQNLNYHTNSFNTVIFNFDNNTLPVILNGEVVNSTFNSNANPTSGGAYQYYITTDTVMFNGCTFNYIGINELTYLHFVNGYINNLYIKYTGGSTQPRGKRNIQKTTGSLIYSAAISTSQSTNLSYSDITLKEATIQQLETLITSLYVSSSTSISLPVFTRGLYVGNRRNVYASTNYPGYVKVDGETITIDSNGVISAVAGGEVVVEDGVGFVPVDTNAVELYVNFTEGDDSNDGLTAETALKTIEKALNKRVSKYIKLHLINPFFSLDGSINNDYVYIIGDGYDKIEVVEWSGTTGTTSLNIFNTDFVWNVDFEIKLNKVINSKVSFVYNQTVKNIVLLEANNSTFTNDYNVRITLKTLDNIYNCIFNGYLNFDSGHVYNSSIFTTGDTTVNNTDFDYCNIPFIKITNTGSSTFFIGCDIGNMTVNSNSTKAITIQDSTVVYLINNLNNTLKINLIRSTINIVDNFDNIEEFYAYVLSAFNIQSQKAVINGINFKYNEPKNNNFIATTNSAGFVKPDGQSILIDAEGVIYASGTAELPIATTEVLGGVKVGSGLSITEDGVLSTTGEISGDVNLIPHNETEITYYVSGLDGNDETNTGLTPDSPLNTLAAALNKHASRQIRIKFDGTLNPDNSITETIIDGFGYRRINLDYVKYGFEDLSEPNLYGPPLYVKNAGLTLNILPRTLRSLNSYVVATHTDGQPSHTPYNIVIENSILQLNDFKSLDSVESDYIDKFIVRNSKVDFTYNGKNQSNPDDYNFIIRYGVIENSIIDTTNVKLDFLHNAETEHYISGSTIRGCVIEFNRDADVSGEDKYLYMNNTSILLKNSALDSTPTISIEKSVLTNCTIANSGYNVNSANTIIANSYLTNCDLDIKLDNNSVSNTLKGCRITGVINNTISHSWVLNTTATDCDIRVSVPYSGLVSGLTMTRCNYVGTELIDENWTLDNTIVNGINKNSAESN